MTLIRSGWHGRCPLCGEKHAACGPPTTTTPVDEQMEVASVAGPLKKYRVTSGAVETVMKLNPADAEQRGLTDSDLVSGRGDDASPSLPDNDSGPAAASHEEEQEPGDDDQEPESESEEKARTAAQNKARTSSANKGRTPRAKGGAGGGD